MGYDALVINRIHHNLKHHFKSTKHMEFFWRGSDVGDIAATDMLTHVLHTHYSAVPGYDWEERGIPVNDGNVAHRAQHYCQVVKERAHAYRTSHLLVPFGDDFKFKNAGLQFRNMDQLVKYSEQYPEKAGCRITYSTPYRYFQALRAHPSASFPVMTGDFFPYADNEDSYWTGYYTTRPFLKQISRQVTSLLRAADIVHSLMRSAANNNMNTQYALVEKDYWEKHFRRIESAREASGLFMHHDAITGTARENVVRDYMNMMTSAANGLKQTVVDLISHALTREPAVPPSLFTSTYLLGIRDAAATVFPYVVYNSLAWPRDELVTLEVESPRVRVFDSRGQSVQAQVDHDWSSIQSLNAQSTEHTASPTKYLLHFIASQVPPLGATTYFIEAIPTTDPPLAGEAQMANTVVYKPGGSSSPGGMFGSILGRGSDSSINGGNSGAGSLSFTSSSGTSSVEVGNDLIRMTVDTKTGLPTKITDVISPDRSLTLRTRLGVYRTSRSGAYIFRPQGQATFPDVHDAITVVSRGAVVDSVRSQVGRHSLGFRIVNGRAGASSLPTTTSTTKGYHDDSSLRSNIAIQCSANANSNEEVILEMGFTELSTSSFYTHNGLGFISRPYHRPPNPLQANFFPAVTAVRINDTVPSTGVSSLSTHPRGGRQVTLLTSHTLAAGQISPGTLQLMLHRSLAQDDGRGLSQAVNDASKIVASFVLSLASDSIASSIPTSSSSPSSTAPSLTTQLNHLFARHNNHLLGFLNDQGLSSTKPSLPLPPADWVPPFVFSAGSEAGPKLAGIGLAIPAIRAWLYTRHPSYQPMRSPLLPHIHLESLMTRDSVTDDTVLRLRGLDPAAIPSTIDIGTLFYNFIPPTVSKDIAAVNGNPGDEPLPLDDHNAGYAAVVTELRPASLSLARVITPKHTYPRRLRFRYSDAIQEQLLAQSVAKADKTAGARQNSVEEGVFISQAALDQQGASGPNARGLKEFIETSPSVSAFTSSSSSSSLSPSSSSPPRCTNLFMPHTPSIISQSIISVCPPSSLSPSTPSHFDDSNHLAIARVHATSDALSDSRIATGMSDAYTNIDTHLISGTIRRPLQSFDSSSSSLSSTVRRPQALVRLAGAQFLTYIFKFDVLRIKGVNIPNPIASTQSSIALTTPSTSSTPSTMNPEGTSDHPALPDAVEQQIEDRLMSMAHLPPQLQKLEEQHLESLRTKKLQDINAERERKEALQREEDLKQQRLNALQQSQQHYQSTLSTPPIIPSTTSQSVYDSSFTPGTASVPNVATGAPQDHPWWITGVPTDRNIAVLSTSLPRAPHVPHGPHAHAPGQGHNLGIGNGQSTHRYLPEGLTGNLPAVTEWLVVLMTSLVVLIFFLYHLNARFMFNPRRGNHASSSNTSFFSSLLDSLSSCISSRRPSKQYASVSSNPRQPSRGKAPSAGTGTGRAGPSSYAYNPKNVASLGGRTD